MNFYDVLAAEKWGGGVPTINFFDLLFAQSISGEQWQTYEGTLPATINANGADMRQYQVWGNVGGVGDKTINYFDYTQLVDGYTYDSNGQMILNPDATSRFYYAAIPFIQVTPGATYLRTNNLTPIGNTVNYYDSEKNFIAKVTPGTGIPFTVPNNCNFITYIVDVKSYDRKKYMLTEGTTPPENYVPFGYKVPIGVKSGNLFNYRDYVDGYYISSSGVETKASKDPQHTATWLNYSGHINIWPDKSYTISAHHQNMDLQQTVAIAWYDDSKIFISRDSTLIPAKNAGSYSFTATAPQNAKFAIFNFFTDDVQKVMFTPGTTPPDEYQPYNNSVTPIYIGDDPLDEDEYIDYRAGKIYRYETEIKKDVSQTGWQWRWETDDVTYQKPANNRVSVGRFYPEEAKEYIISAVPDTFEVAVISADSSDIKTADTGWDASWTLSGASAHSFCVTVRKSDNSDITPSEVDGIKFKVTSLTPTNPPVTLPALPTAEGTTIIDYAGQSVAPEKVVFEYKKGGN